MLISHTYSDIMIRAINARLPLLLGNKFGFTPLEINRSCGHGLVDPQPPTSPFNYDFYKDFSRELNIEYQNLEEWNKPLKPTSESTSSSAASSKTETSMPAATPTAPWSSYSSDQQNKSNHGIISQIVTEIITKTLPDDPAFKQQRYIDSLVKIHLGVLERAYHQQVGCSLLTQLCKISTFFPNLLFRTEQKLTVKHLHYDIAKQTWILEVQSTVEFVTDQPSPNPLFNRITVTTFSHLGPFPAIIDSTTEINLQACIDKYAGLFTDGFILKQIRIEAENPYLELFNKLLGWNSVAYPDFLKYLAAPLSTFISLENSFSHLFGSSTAEKLCKLITEEHFEWDVTPQEMNSMRAGQLKPYAQDLSPAIYFLAPNLFKVLGYNFNYIPRFIFQQEQHFGI